LLDELTLFVHAADTALVVDQHIQMARLRLEDIHDACRGLDLLKELGEPEARNELRLWFENVRNAAKTTGALIKYGLASRDRALCKKVDKLIDLASKATPEQLAILAAGIPDDWQLADTSVKQLALTVSPAV
jgi:hypothetical protein